MAFAAAATAAAAYATKLVVDGVQSAIQDEVAQLRLANALKAATGATDAQIKATLPKDFNILEKLAAKAKKVNLVCNFQDDEVEESKTNY